MSSTPPMYQQIASDLREQIADGTLAIGAKVPTEAELRASYGCSRGTARHALDVLDHDGLLKTVSRSGGRIVRGDDRWRYRPQAEWRDHPQSPELDRWMTDATAAGKTPSQSITVEIINPPPDIALRLDVAPNSLVVVRRRTRFLDGEPDNINDSHHPLHLVQGSEIMVPNDVARGTNQVLTDLGYDQVRVIDEVEQRMPLPSEIQRLRLDPGSPVAVHRATGFDASGTPVRCTVNILPKHVIVWERTKGELDPRQAIAEADQ